MITLSFGRQLSITSMIENASKVDNVKNHLYANNMELCSLRVQTKIKTTQVAILRHGAARESSEMASLLEHTITEDKEFQLLVLQLKVNG